MSDWRHAPLSFFFYQTSANQWRAKVVIDGLGPRKGVTVQTPDGKYAEFPSRTRLKSYLRYAYGATR